MSSPQNERSILEAVFESTEAAIDFAVSNEAIAAVPVVGPAFKLAKGWDDYKSRLLRVKLARFLNEPSLRAAVEARKFRESLLVDNVRDQEVGETLLMVLDKVTDMTKPLLLAKAYAAYLDEEIDQYALLALLHAIDVSFILDLQTFIRTGGADAENETLWRERLASSGLFVTHITGGLSGSDVDFFLAPLGGCLLHVVKHSQGRSP